MARKRSRDDDRDIFDLWYIEEEFEEMQRYMERLMSEMVRGLPRTESFVYGFSMRVGPDGKPSIQRFGNFRPAFSSGEELSAGEREPLTDIITDKDSVAVTVEIPGVRKEEIDLSVTERNLRIHVDSANRRYFKDIELPTGVDPNTVKATYNNGVLDITIKRRESGAHRGRKIAIE